MFTDIYISTIVVALIALLIIARQKREIAALLSYYVTGVSMYFFVDVESYGFYYVSMCFVALISGFMVRRKFKVAAMCSYLLVFVNVLGYLLWYKYYPHDLYNTFSGILLIIQFISILPKATSNGVVRSANGYSVDGCCNFDGNKRRDTMFKKHQESKK